MGAQRRETSVIEHEVRIDAPPETVFAYFTDPARMVQWMGADATLDPRPGGIFRLAFDAPEEFFEYVEGKSFTGPNVVLGEFVEVEPYRRIVFTWGYERRLFTMPPQATTVEVSLVPDGESTVLRLVHRRLPPVASDFHRGGWEHYLPRLEIAAAGGDPGPDPWRVASSA